MKKARRGVCNTASSISLLSELAFEQHSHVNVCCFVLLCSLCFDTEGLVSLGWEHVLILACCHKTLEAAGNLWFLHLSSWISAQNL